MKKLYQLIVMAVMAISMTIPGFSNTAEAANIVILPLINNVSEEGVDSVYYDNAVNAIKDQTKYEMLDGNEVENAISKYTTKGNLPDVNALRSISEAVDADLVVCVELNKINVESEYGHMEDRDILTILGNTVSYNKENNQFKKHKIDVEERYDPAMYIRQNYPLRKWARIIQSEMHSIMNVKKFKVEKPRMAKF